MNIAICEDEQIIIDELEILLSDFFNEKRIDITVSTFLTANEFLSSNESFDLVLLDYQLPDMTGMDVARSIRSSSRKTTVVFITAFSEYVFESFEVDTFRYLLKPIDSDEFRKMLSDFINSFERFSRVEIPLEDKTVFANLSEIMYIESSGRYSAIRLVDTTYTSTKPISAFQAEINSFRFFRTHRSFLVNMKYIAATEGNTIFLTNGEKAIISRRNLSTFNKCYMNFLKYYDY